MSERWRGESVFPQARTTLLVVEQLHVQYTGDLALGCTAIPALFVRPASGKCGQCALGTRPAPPAQGLEICSAVGPR